MTNTKPQPAPPLRERNRRRLVAALGFVMLAATAAAHLYLLPTTPFLDEGDHAATGRLLLHGGVMYRDAFNEKGPGLYWITATSFALFGEHFEVVRHASMLGMLWTLVALLGLGARMGPGSRALTPAALFAALHLLLLGRHWQAESVLTPLVVSIALLWSGDEDERLSAWRYAAIGAALFAATCVKQTAWPLALATAAALAVGERGRAGYPRAAAAFTAGLALPWLFVLSVAWANGSIGDFLDGYFFPITAMPVSAAGHLPQRAEWPIEAPVAWTALAGLIFARPGDRRGREYRVFVVTLIASLPMLIPSLFPHRFLPLLAVSTWGFVRFAGDGWAARPKARRWIVGAITACALIGAAWAAPTQYRLRVGRFEAGGAAAKAREIAARTAAGDPILVFPHDSTLYFLADRPAAGRHGFLLPWTTTAVATNETTRLIAARAPRLVVYAYLHNLTPEGPSPCRYLEPVCERLSACYRLDTTLPDRVVLLAPRDACLDENNADRCAVDAILHADEKWAIGSRRTLDDLVRFRCESGSAPFDTTDELP